MKKLLSILFVCLCLPVYALDIPLEPIDPGKRGIGNDKELILVPSASIEDGVINIETAMASWGVTVTIYNGDGAVVYSAVSAEEGKSHSFIVGSLPADLYTIDVQLGEDYYTGEFSL